jgi:PEP-CTERM motif
MMKKVAVGLAISASLVSQAFAASFVNGGFEDGNFGSWTQGGGTVNTGPSYSSNGSNRNAIVTAGLDAYTNNNLNRVYSGTYSARVEDSANGSNYSTITQRVNNYTSNNIFFAWATVLEDPGHTAAQQPRFSVILRDETSGTEVYNVTFDVSNPGSVVLKNGAIVSGEQWKYTDWQVQNLDVSSRLGHDFSLTVLAADCTLGGHGGYAYVDGFGNVTPPSGNVPLPASVALLGIGALGLFGLRRKV